MARFFNINPTDMSDGSGRLYSLDTPEGERVASTTSESAARELRDALNLVLRSWQAKHGSDAVVECDLEPDAPAAAEPEFTVIGYRPGRGYFCENVSAPSAALAGHRATFGIGGYPLPDVTIIAVLEGRQTSLFGVA